MTGRSIVLDSFVNAHNHYHLWKRVTTDTGADTSCLVLRMRGVPAIDATAMNALQNLYKKCESQGISLVLSHVNEQPLQAMKKAGFYDKVGADNFCAHIDEALSRAEKIN